MKTSARNAFRCQVTALKRALVNIEVIMKLSDDNEIVAMIASDSVEKMGVIPGREVVALVKSSFVVLAKGDQAPCISARNLLKGKVSRRTDGGVSSEIVLDLGGGESLTSVIARESADSLLLKEGDPVYALFKASHVILALG